jgi:hypothetical protein
MENEKGVACSKYGKHENCIQNCSRENWTEDTTRNNFSVGEEKFSTGLIQIKFEGVNLINLAQNSD